MNKRIYKVLLPLLMISLCLFSLLDTSTVTVKADQTSAHIIDQADLLTDEEESNLEKKCTDSSSLHNTNICIVTTNDFGDGDIKDWQRSYFASHKMGANTDGNGIMLAISMAERDWGMVGFGDAQNAFTKYGRERIADLILDDLKDGDYYDAFDSYVDICDEFLVAFEDGEPFDSGNKYNEGVPVYFIIPGAFLISLIISLIIVMSWKKAMNTRILQDSATEYLNKDSFHLTKKKDTFLYFTVSRTKRESKSGGSISSDSSGSSGKF